MPEPKRVRVAMPDGNNYLFPEGTTPDQILSFTQENFGFMRPVPSHGRVDTEVEPEAPESPVGEESGITVPSHAPTLTMEEKARQLDVAGPAATAETLYASGRGEGTPMDRARSGVLPAPPPTIDPFDLGGTIGGPEPPKPTLMTLPGQQGGMLEGGNLDLLSRPSVPNPEEGGTSSVFSMSIGVDGKEFLIPRVSEDGRLLTELEAVETFRETGNHLGIFDSPESATAYAIKLHEQQAALAPPPPTIGADPDALVDSSVLGGAGDYVNRGARFARDVASTGAQSFLRVGHGLQSLGEFALPYATTSIPGGPPPIGGEPGGARQQEMSAMYGDAAEGVRSVLGTPGVMADEELKRKDPLAFAGAGLSGLAAQILPYLPAALVGPEAGLLKHAAGFGAFEAAATGVQTGDVKEAIKTGAVAAGTVAAFGLAFRGIKDILGTLPPRVIGRRLVDAGMDPDIAEATAKSWKEMAADVHPDRAATRAEAKVREDFFKRMNNAAMEGDTVTLEAVYAEFKTWQRGQPGFEEPPAKPEKPPEPPRGPKEPPEGEAPPVEPTKPVEPVEPPPRPKGPLKLVETEGGYLIEGQHSAIYEIHKGGENIGMAQLRLNPDGNIIIVDHMETFGEPATVRGILELKAEAIKLFPDAEFIAGQTASAEERARGELGEWRTFPLRPKKEAPPEAEAEPETGIEPVPAPEAEGEPITQEILDERYAQQDKLKADLEKKGAGSIVDTEGNTVNFKVVGDTPKGPYWYERTIAGQREKITEDVNEYQPGPFRTLYLAQVGALNDAQERVGLGYEVVEGAALGETRVVDQEEMKRVRAAYSADKLTESKPKARTAVVVDGKKYVTVGGSSVGGEEQTQGFEEVPIADFIEEFGEEAVVRDRTQGAGDRQRRLVLGSYHGTAFKRGKNEYVLKGPPITFETEGYAAAGKLDAQEKLIGSRINAHEGKHYPHAMHGANISDYLNPEWEFNQLARAVTRILDKFELTDNDLIGLRGFFDPNTDFYWTGDRTPEQMKVLHGFERRIAEMIDKREIDFSAKGVGPDNVPVELEEDMEGPLDLQMDTDWTVKEMSDYMNNLIDNWELTTEEAQILDDFLNPEREDPWVPPDLTVDNASLVDAVQARIDEMLGTKTEPRYTPEAAPEPTEPTAPYRVGQVIWRNRDGMSAEVIRVTPKKDSTGKVVRHTIRLEFYDGHKHSFGSAQVDKSFSTVPKEEGAEPPEKPKKPAKKKKPKGPTEKERYAYGKEKETKTAAKLVEATPEELATVRAASQTPQWGGFTKAQRAWFTKTLKGYETLVDPVSPGPPMYALEVRVPDDGTFFFTHEGAEKMYKTLARKGKKEDWIVAHPGPSLRIKYTAPSMAHTPLPYSRPKGWSVSRATEKKGVYSDGYGMIVDISPDAPKTIKDRITKVDPDYPKTSTDSVSRVIKGAREGKDIIRVRGLIHPNPSPAEAVGEWGIQLETKDGTRITHFTISWDRMRFIQDATGFDTMKTDLRDPKAIGPVAMYREGKLVGVLMPSRDVHFQADEPAPASEEANGESPPGEGTKASMGRYRAFSEQNEPHGPKGTALAPVTPPQLRVLPLGFPELVKLARALGRGRYPRIRRIIRRNPGYLGIFYHPRVPGAAGPTGIELKASIFADPDQAAGTLAHEIGHWIDYLPERLFTRGNLLGRIAGLVKYQKKTMSMLPDVPDHLTPEDRARLRKEARAVSREEYYEEVEEVIRKEFGITVDDVLNIWRQYIPDVPKALHDYIKKLSDAQKISIAKQAMKGLLAPELDRFKRVVEERTGKMRRVKKVRYIDAEKKFQELLRKELDKRHLATIEEIRNEMWALSIAWRPLPVDPSRKHLTYRQKGEEMYADAISALLNDPDFFARTAPKSYQMMIAYLQKNPAMWDDYQMLQQLAQDPELLNDDRLSNYQRMVKEGAIARGEQMKERFGIGQPLKEKVMDLGTALASAMIDKNSAWYRLRRKARKNPGIKWLEENDPIHNIEELAYANSRYAYYLDRWQAEVQGVIGDLLNDTDFGVLLGLRRAGRPRKRGGRKELANPLGIGGKDARELISHLFKKKGITTDEARVIAEALKNWQEIRMEIFDEIEKVGMLSPKLVKVLRDSVGSYATFQVRRFIEDPDPAVNAAMGNIKRQVGTLSEIGNPVIETILKDLSLARAAHRTQTIKYMIEQLVEAEEGAVIPAFQKKIKGVRVGFPDPPEGMDLVTYLENGQVRGVYMNEEYAKALTRPQSGPVYQYYRLMTGVVRAVMVTHNPAWAIWNLQRDFRAMVVNATPANAIVAPFMALKWTLAAAPEAFRDVSRNGPTMRTLASIYKAVKKKELNVEALTVREMMKESALIQTGMRFYKAADILDEEASALLFEFYGISEARHQTMVRSVIGHLGAILSNPGQFSERVIKIGGYKMLKAHQEELRLTDKEISHLVRTRVGTPDIMRKNDWFPITNSLALFSNVAKEGYRAAWEAFEEDPVRYSSKTILYDILPTIVKWLAASGAFGVAIKALYDRIPEYHKRTYTVIPIGLTTSGKAVYLIFPHDHVGQLLISSTWAALERDKSLQQEIAWEAAQNFPWSHGSIHPYIESLIQWGLYSSGINPQDWFRGRSVVPDKVWEAGDKKRSRNYMYAGTWDNIGGRILTDFAGLGMEDQNGDVDPQKIADWIEKGSGWPVAGSFLKRFIRVSDGGVSEKGFDLMREMRQPKKLATLERDLLIEEVLKQNHEADGWTVWAELQRREQDPAYTYDSEEELVKKLDTRTNTLRLRVHGSVLDRLWSYAVGDEEGEAIDELERRLNEPFEE